MRAHRSGQGFGKNVSERIRSPASLPESYGSSVKSHHKGIPCAYHCGADGPASEVAIVRTSCRSLTRSPVVMGGTVACPVRQQSAQQAIELIHFHAQILGGVPQLKRKSLTTARCQLWR